MLPLPHSPAAQRNRQPIWETLRPYLKDTKRILEIASGTGEHIEYMAPRTPKITWQPSDGDPEMIWAINTRLNPQKNVEKAVHINVCTSEWNDLSYDVLFCANMIHISPWESTLALFNIANPNQYLVLYGPFKENGIHNSQGNIQFDASLRMRNSTWGIRDLNDLRSLAAKNGFSLQKQHPMPANNFILIWKKDSQ